jgi:DNA modification methylase
MENFKSLDEITKIDKKHQSMGVICGYIPTIEDYHEYLSKEILNNEVPEEISGQFNVAKNMALYTYYFYARAPEVDLKTYTVNEHALRVKAYSRKRMGLADLLRLAIKEKWIKDSGFRHLDKPSSKNDWCKSMIKVIPSMRNAKAHGSSMLVGDCLSHVSHCADFINQLFPATE